MKTKQHFSRFFCVILLSMFISSVTMLSVTANNHTDTSYSYDFNDSYEFHSTAYRQKIDNSSSYMYCQSCSSTLASYSARVYGADNLATEAVDLSGGYTYTFYAGITHFMYNYVYEGGYAYAGIVAISWNGSGQASGLWSPDSV